MMKPRTSPRSMVLGPLPRRGVAAVSSQWEPQPRPMNGCSFFTQTPDWKLAGVRLWRAFWLIQ